MRALGLLLFLAANAVAFAFVTYPIIRQRGALSEREGELAAEMALKERELVRWEEIAGWVERAGPVLAEIYGAEESFLPRLRQTLLALERGLPLRRSLTEYRSEAVAEGGFPGSRIRVVLEGDFSDLFAYLERVAKARTPLAPTEMSLVEDPSSPEGDRLFLTLSFLALWPK